MVAFASITSSIEATRLLFCLLQKKEFMECFHLQLKHIYVGPEDKYYLAGRRRKSSVTAGL